MQIDLKQFFEQYYRSMEALPIHRDSTSVVMSTATAKLISPEVPQLNPASYGTLAGVRVVFSEYVPLGFAVWRDADEAVKVLDLRKEMPKPKTPKYCVAMCVGCTYPVYTDSPFGQVLCNACRSGRDR